MCKVRWCRTEWIALGLVLLPLVVSAGILIFRVGNDYHPVSDWALTEIRTRDVGHHPVLIGLYSRDGWSHPGPMSFYLLAIPYRLTGGASIGLWLGALLINGVAIVGMAVVARRRGGVALMMCVLLGSSLLLRTLGADCCARPVELRRHRTAVRVDAAPHVGARGRPRVGTSGRNRRRVVPRAGPRRVRGPRIPAPRSRRSLVGPAKRPRAERGTR